MVGAFEQALLAAMIFVIMLGMGASLTPRDFWLALKRPYGLMIGVVSQYGFMPFIGFVMAITLNLPEPIAVGLLIVACMPGGTTSNIFTYFSKGNLALSVLMTVTSTVFGVLLIPIVLLIYASALDLEIPRENIIATLVILLIPVAIGMGCASSMPMRRGDGVHGLGARALLHRLHRDLLGAAELAVPADTTPATYFAAIMLGVFGIAIGYGFARACGCTPATRAPWRWRPASRTRRSPSPSSRSPSRATKQQGIIAVGALYSLFIVMTSTLVTLIFRRANTAAEQKLPDGLL
jgi:BASS family bile acid:Na+ symporter